LNLLSDIITYIRRLVKTPSNGSLNDNLIIDYINRFWIMDMDARVQLYDLKTNYTFQTIPGIATYNMPMYNTQKQAIDTVNPFPPITSYPVYQGFMQPAYVNGIQVPFYTEQNAFWNLWPNYIQYLNPAAYGNGTTGPYTISLAEAPAIPGHLDMTGIVANINNGNGNNDPYFANAFPLDPLTGFINLPTTSFFPGVYFTATAENGQLIEVADSGIYLETAGTNGDLYGLLMAPGNAPNSNLPLSGGYSITSNTVNYNTGIATVTFPTAVPEGAPINAESQFFQPGLPRAILFYNNTMTIRPPPDISYNIQLQAYLSPAAFLSSGQAIPFGYMAEYIARGAARKLLADTGDIEQFQFYEPLFKEQETLVWKRSQRQITSNRTGTIFSDLQGQTNFNQIGAAN
jgi:hypothetical protein